MIELLFYHKLRMRTIIPQLLSLMAFTTRATRITSPRCRDCIFFDPNPTYISGYLISEGRCLKSGVVMDPLKQTRMNMSPVPQ